MVLPPKIVIVGGGPVGALAGLYAAKRGFRVEVYDLRDDIQKPSLRVDASKSLNLTLSERGLQAIAGAECPGLLENVIKDAVPIHCRMVHGVNGDKLTQKSMKYDNGTFACALFAPESVFHRLEKEPESIIPFFRANFPGVTPDLIPTEDIVRHFSTNPHFPLLTTKCNKYHYGDSFLLVGDACHALVPFYGVGMNVGFEDVQTFFRDFLDKGKKFDGTLSPLSEKHGELEIGASICTVALLDAYTAHRRPDIHAITDLALEHYDALKVGVNTWSYLLRRWIEDTLEFYAPGMGWTTTYNRVTYGKERFSEVVKKEQGQGQVLAFAAGLLCVGLFVALLYLIGL
ncbi:hypothetical protein LTR28_009296 [Elasticomyces elasticus]|nr:hypothetical protein LTR28_009296 [Elasticomyces elasticus]